MNILHVLSQFEVTGAETFAATLADAQILNGHTVYIISDTFHSPTNAVVVNHPIGKRDLPQRYSNVVFLKEFIKDHNIDVVDAHSRAASWVSYFATRRGITPLVSHIHAQQHIHFSSKHFPVYGEKLVAVCGTIYAHLNKDLKYSLDKLSLVKNGIDLTAWTYKVHKPNKGKKIVSYVGRLSGFKGDTLLKLIEETFPEVMKSIPNTEIHIIGGMNEKSKIMPTIEQVNARIGKKCIIPKGFSDDVKRIYHSSDVIIGSGRVAMEALACGAPVISVGESNYVGIVGKETEKKAVDTNFGDLDKRRPIDTKATANDILAILKNPRRANGAWGRAFIEGTFNITNVALSLDSVYAEACAVKKGIQELPILSYSRVSPAASGEHAIPVQEFEQQMEFLRSRKYALLTFKDLKEIVCYKKPIPRKPLILTFDGNEDNFNHCYPLLRRNQMPGVFFITTGTLRTESYLTKDQIQEMHHHGMEMGSGSVTGRKFNLLPDKEVQKEVRQSHSAIQKLTGVSPLSFAYPSGVVNEKAKSAVRDAGYDFAVALAAGRRNFWADLLKIRRIHMHSGISKITFWGMVSGRYYWYNDVY